MANVFFTADTHFGHGNIIKYCNRPFTHADGSPDPEAQDEAIIKRFNEVLRPGDLLYHLGDVSWSSFDIQRRFLDRLNTKEVHLILGNHDKHVTVNKFAFKSVCDLRKFHVGKQSVILCHYPMRSWDGKGKGTPQLYGHVHGKMPGIGRQMDVGVDTNNFYPWAWEDIWKQLQTIPWNSYD